jgi:hypothetical protein
MSKKFSIEIIEIPMSNDKQSMKLYTEEQVLQIIGNLNREYFVTPQELLEEMKLTSIELPSDEEIDKESLKSDFKYTFRNGAKWMRNKIQGGEQ